MTKRAYYNAAELALASQVEDSYLRPAFSRWDRLKRGVWNLCWLFLYRPSPRPIFAWRTFLLRSFGAKLGPNCKFYPGAKIYAPWNLTCADLVAVADGAEIYNPAPIQLGSHAIVSQGAYLCGATHDFNNPEFPLLAYSMSIGAYAWVCARACVAPGVNLADGAVLGLASVATRDLESWSVYAGVPAVKVKERATMGVAEAGALSSERHKQR